MERPVEVAVFQRGELQSVRALSPRGERRTALFAGAVTAAVVVHAMAVTMAIVSTARQVVHAPTFFTSWLIVAAGAGMVAARRARARARRYAIGAHLDADAFAAVDVDLVRRVGRGDDYDVGLVPGMTGVLEHGRSPLAVEALTRAGATRVPLPPDGKVRIDVGPSTFVIRRRAEAVEPPAPWDERMRAGIAGARRMMPFAAAAVPLAALVTVVGSVPAVAALSEADMKSSIPVHATPWEIEQHIRARAQRQVATLYRCFDPLPLRCQKPGFVSVRLSLGKDGEVRAHRVSRSTYGQECPVSQCMADEVAAWFFEPMREGMEMVLPIQVRRTNRPLYDPQPFIAHPVILGDPFGDAGALEVVAH